MSIVIAIKTDDGIVMGCDSQVSYGDTKYGLDNVSSCKVWEISHCPFGLMGSVGSLRDLQIIAAQDFLINPAKLLDDTIDINYVVCELYMDIYDVLKSYGRVSSPILDDIYNLPIQPPELSNEFIFSYWFDAWHISADGCVREIQDYLVMGSGSEMAIGILDNNKDKSPEERIKEAIETCCKNNLYIDKNITFFYTIPKDEEISEFNTKSEEVVENIKEKSEKKDDSIS